MLLPHLFLLVCHGQRALKYCFLANNFQYSRVWDRYEDHACSYKG